MKPVLALILAVALCSTADAWPVRQRIVVRQPRVQRIVVRQPVVSQVVVPQAVFVPRQQVIIQQPLLYQQSFVQPLYGGQVLSIQQSGCGAFFVR